MKRLTKLSILITTLFLALPLAAQEEESTKTSPWSFSVSTDFAYYPLSAPIVSENTHFSTFTGPYSGLEGRTTAHAYYTIPTPIGNNPLTAGDNITLEGYFELSPVSIKPGLSVSFTPIAFLVFNAGAEIGKHAIINSGAIVEHDCRVGSFTHVAVGATVCGGCTIEEDAFIGAGSTLIQGLTIERCRFIKAGEVVVR